MNGLDVPATLTSAGRLPSFAAATPRPAAAAGDLAGARRSAEDFTSFFLSQSLESMYAGMASDGLFGGGTGETVYRSLMLQEYGKVMARTDGSGIVDAVQREILRMQETAQASRAS